ncbi:hypothetical protein ACFPRL_30220 [Pseudoclavibacter helvolus]
MTSTISPSRRATVIRTRPGCVPMTTVHPKKRSPTPTGTNSSPLTARPPHASHATTSRKRCS